MVARAAEGEPALDPERPIWVRRHPVADCESLDVDMSPVSNGPSRWDHAEKRRFRAKHALRSLEDALMLLRTRPAEGVEIAALERVRDDLAIVLRLAEADCR
jgi:hypothetical protein